jgi:hypothetical protein
MDEKNIFQTMSNSLNSIVINRMQLLKYGMFRKQKFKLHQKLTKTIFL